MLILQIIDLLGIKMILEVKFGDMLMESLCDNGYDEILVICGGVCFCFLCYVYIEFFWQVKMGFFCEDEYQLVSSIEYYWENLCLFCQIILMDDMDGMEVVIVNQVY